MAITDYKEPAPQISALNSGSGLGGVSYGIDYVFTANYYGTIFSEYYGPAANKGTLMYPSANVLTTGFNIAVSSMAILTAYVSGQTYGVENPIWYRQQTPARIALSAAHHECGIAEADIDTTSFSTVHTWADGNSIYRSCALIDEPVINILHRMFEMSLGIYLYVNGSQQLACGYFEDEPSDTPDWTIDNSNFIKVLEFGKIKDRKMPIQIKTFYDPREKPIGNPSFGCFTFQNASAPSYPPDMILDKEYDALYIDDTTEHGSYVNFDDYLYTRIQINHAGHLMDISETFKLDMEELGMSIDSDYKDNFVIHDIELDLDNMSAIITGIKKVHWNIP